MQRATRDFIDARKRYAKGIERAYVKQVGGGAGDSFAAASAQVERIAGVTLMSGWLVNPFDNETQSSEIVLHWWNVDDKGQHFDVTPPRYRAADYVADPELLTRGEARVSLLHNHGRFIAVDEAADGTRAYRELSTLNVKDIVGDGIAASS